MLKQLLSLFAFFIINTIAFAQCDIDYYVTSNPNDNCFVAGNDITFNYPTPVYWTINNYISGGPNGPGTFTAQNNISWTNPTDGIYIITVYAGFGLTICSDTIIITPGPVTLQDIIPLSYCQGNTINLETILTSPTYLQNGGSNPQYSFSIGGIPINGLAYLINNSVTIDATVLNSELSARTWSAIDLTGS